jgi:hypothetical protein
VEIVIPTEASEGERSGETVVVQFGKEASQTRD